jgi:hypothetical protein
MKNSPSFILHYLRAGLFVFSFAAIVAANAEPFAAQISIKSVNGHAVGCTNGGTFYALHSGDVAGPGTTLQTDADSTVDLILQDSGTVLRILPDTTLEFAKLNKQPAGEQVVTETSLKLVKGSVIGSQRKLAIPSHFDIATAQSVANIVGTEYVVSASGAVTVLSGSVSINYNKPGKKGSVKVTIPQGYTFDPANGKVVPTDPKYLKNIIADVNTVKQNAQTFKAGGATIVVKPEKFVSPTKSNGNNGVGNGVDPQPPGNPPVNDGPGTSPGNPGNKGGANK